MIILTRKKKNKLKSLLDKLHAGNSEDGVMYKIYVSKEVRLIKKRQREIINEIKEYLNL